MFEHQLLAADAGALVDGALDGVARDAFPARFFQGGIQPCIAVGIGSALLGGDRDFAQELAAGL
jgi:hypothetical protein